MHSATTAIYTLSLHDALPILPRARWANGPETKSGTVAPFEPGIRDPAKQSHPRRTQLSKPQDRKSTRLNSSHTVISYAVFCLKKKTQKKKHKVSKNNHNNATK